ncbi:MAG: hypothetical protein HY290_10715 [Planctomycetia bacterium]|nr:hypothetical protein [Planctomycetia bacterium]
MNRSMLGGIALVAAVGLTLLVPNEAHARRRCCNGVYGYGGHHGGYYQGTYTNQGTYMNSGTYAAPGSPCAGTPAPTNPDGSIAPEPGNPPAATNAPPPPSAPSPAPPSTSSNTNPRGARVIRVRL